MEGNAKLWIVLATLLVLGIAVVVPPWMHRSRDVKHTMMKNQPAELSTDAKIKNQPANFWTIRFSTASSSADSYSNFLEELRARLRSGELRQGIPVLREPATLTQVTDQYILVELTNHIEESVTLVISVDRVYFYGYRAGGNSYFVRDAPDSAYQQVFPETRRDRFSFTSNYGSLQTTAGQQRENIPLGLSQLNQAISFLYHTHESHSERNQAYAFLVIIQMISEAARFRVIENLVRSNYGRELPIAPPLYMRSLENSWDPLSEAVQQSTWPVRIQRSYPDDWYEITGVDQRLVNVLALMFYVCGPRPQMQRYRFPFSSFLGMPSTLLSVFSIKGKNGQSNTGYCDDPEHTVHIIGRDGLCVDVSNGYYNDGNPIIIWPCHSNIEIVNQKWTLKRDGTIRSDDKCLTTYAYSPGSYVMIYDCAKAVTAATHWELKDEGTIVNPKSGLVLTATGSKGTTLTVETDFQASRQGWLATNDTHPFVTNIIGLKDLCLETNGNEVWLEKCETDKAEQKWDMYADGSIRTSQSTEKCITSDGLSMGRPVVIRSCSSASSSQRWLFRYDGSILSLNSGLVMDVKASTPSLKEIIIWSPTGNPNQKWSVSMI